MITRLPLPMMDKKTIADLYGIFIILIILSRYVVAVSPKCAGGLAGTTPGYTVPSGDFTKLKGENLTILCVIDLALAKGLNSSNIIFTRGTRELPKELTRVINETTAELFIEKPEPMSQMFFCTLKDPVTNNNTSVCMNYVTIGTSPQDPDDFHCVSKNWEVLVCEFHMKENYVPTDYTVQFYLPNTKQKFYHNCPNMTKDEEKKTISCFWSLDTSVQYRQAHREYIFIVTMRNIFGTKTYNYTFAHYKNIIPAKPSYMEIRDKTSHSAVVVWNVTRPLNAFTPGLNHMIKYISEYENSTTQWKVADTSTIPRNSTLQYKFNLTDLKYAYARYDVRVQIKVATAPDDPTKWSNFNSMTFRTLPEIPSRPPETVRSSFEVVDKLLTRDILIYWQSLEEYEKNGPDFKYAVDVKVNGVSLSDWPYETNNSYANFTDLKFDKEYEFSLISLNSQGRSVNKSLIYVPRKDQIVNQPSYFTKMSLSDLVYQLSWTIPLRVKNISNYTIFWCQSDLDRPIICRNSLEWDTVPANETSHNVTVKTNKNYQFAISVNTPTSSSGMAWAKCTVLNSGIGKMKTVKITTVGDTYMIVSWNLECSELIGIVSSFKVYYCIISTPDGVCEGETQYKKFYASDKLISARVTDLQPYTTYQVNVTVITKDKEGLPSDPLYFTTLESAPTQPLNVKDISITNSSITVTWDAPERINGVFKNYIVYYKSKYGIRETTINNITDRKVTMRDLFGYTDYSIYVRACTTLCSNNSDELKVRTHISHPSKILLPRFNDTTFLMSWHPPEYPGGLLDYYEILFTRKRGDVTTQELYNTTRTEFTLPDASCDTKSETSFSFHVRAVNRVSDYPYSLAGNWSDPYGNICFPGKNNSRAFVWMGGILGGMALLIMAAFACKRCYEYIEEMKKIEVRLPPGISSAIAKEKGDNYFYDETSLLPPKSDKLFPTLDNNTINTTFSSKGVSDDSGLHNKSDDIISNKWLNTNGDLGNSIKLDNISGSLTEEWLITDDDSKKSSDGYLSNTNKYCLVGAENNTLDNNKPTHGYVQAVMPVQNNIQKPYESFECTTLKKPYVETSQNNMDSTLSYTHMPPINAEKPSQGGGYLPITCLPGVEQPTRSLLSPNTPEDSQDDDESMSQIKTCLKRSDTAPGYMKVDALPSAGIKVHTPLTPNNSMIPKGYVKAAEMPSVDNQTNSSYVTLGDVNKQINTDVCGSKKLLNNTMVSNGYVQHTVNN